MALYDILQKKGISATKLAQMTGFKRTTIHDWLHSPERVPNGNKMLKLCEVLNVTPNEVLGVPDALKQNTESLFLKELFLAATFDGQNQSGDLHEMANRFALAQKTGLASHFRRLAFVVAKMEQRGKVFKWQTLQQGQQGEQMRLF